VFEALPDKLTGVFDRLRRRGALNETDVAEAVREVRLALLDADVARSVVREFISKVRDRAMAAEVLDSMTPRPAGGQDPNDLMPFASSDRAKMYNAPSSA
jgi:signal recognition particle subunit SRP54